MSERLPQERGISVVGGIRCADDVADRLAGADVLVDFTHAGSTSELLLAAIEAGVRSVHSTSGAAESPLDVVCGLWVHLARLVAVLKYQASPARRNAESENNYDLAE
ncbi:hypothetical protein [Kribbella sp. NPDC049227]|uniref:hypothetical protein n=1 Tax=Kribbella sp. NPDC049227 TaxID=3364113 RepID=UPI0037237300